MKKYITLISVWVMTIIFVSIASDANINVKDTLINPIYTVEVTSRFNAENSEITHSFQLEYNSHISFDLDDESGFAFWIINGVVRDDLKPDHSFVVKGHKDIQAIYSGPNEHAVVFMDSNGKLLGIQYVQDGAHASDITEGLPEKPGYVISIHNKWNLPLENITSDTVRILQYEIDRHQTFSLNLINGEVTSAILDGEEVGIIEDNKYPFNTMISVEANTREDEVFLYWMIDHRIVSYDNVYSFTMLSDQTVEAVYGAEAVEARPLIFLSDMIELRTNQESFMAQYYLPEGYSLIEYGMLTTNETLNFRDLEIGRDGVIIHQGFIYTALSNEFLMTFTTKYEMVRGYMVVEYEGELEYIYTDPIDLSQIFINHGNYYQLFVRSFADSTGDGIGDFNGIRENLDYFVELGIDGIWLMPIHPSNSMHGYDVLDFYDVHEDYGTLDDFIRLVEEAKALGIDIIIDYVLNHTSNHHPWFEAFLDGNPKYEDYYRRIDENDPRYNLKGSWAQTIWHSIGDGTYYAGYFNGMLPDLNWSNKAVQQEMLDIALFWMDLGVAGFRLDAALHLEAQNEISQEYENAYLENMARLRDWEAELRAVYPDVYVVGEIWSDFNTYLPFFEVMDSAFHFEYGHLVMEAILNGGHKYYAQRVATWEYMMRQYEGAISAPFLRNHDQDRLASELGGDETLHRLAAEMLLTIPGNPYIYYGDELGMKGVRSGQAPIWDESVRLPFLFGNNYQTTWSIDLWGYRDPFNDDTRSLPEQREDQSSLYHTHKRLLNLRQESAALKYGEIIPYEGNTINLQGFYRVLNIGHSTREVVLVLHNLSDEALDLDINGEVLYVSTGEFRGELDGKSTVIIRMLNRLA